MSSTYKLTRGYFYFVAVFFTISNLGGVFLNIPNFVFYSGFGISTVWLFWKLIGIGLPRRVKLLIIVIFPLAFFNIVLSIEPYTSAIYWISTLSIYVSFSKIILKLTRYELELLESEMPRMLAIASLLLLIIIYPHINEGLTTKNSLGMFAGGLTLLSLGIANFFFRFISVLLGLSLAIISDSRSALVYAVILLLLYYLSRIRRFSAAQILIILLTVVCTFGYVTSFLGNKILEKEAGALTASTALELAFQERNDLLVAGWKLFVNRPFFGFGLSAPYENLLNLGLEKEYHVHNGYLATLIEVGLVISVIMFYLLFRSLKNILANVRLSHFRISHIESFLLFGYFRAYGESYLFFNIGNLFSLLFVFLFLKSILTSNSWRDI